MRYDVLIIGGGVTGCAIARQLARWKLSVALLEAREDVAMGASRANSAIVHAGYDAQSGTLMAAMNVRGNALYDSWCRELEVPLQRIGSLVIAFDEADEKELKNLYERGVRNGVPGLEIVDGSAGARTGALAFGQGDRRAVGAHRRHHLPVSADRRLL